ncbi:hypothetical protein [Azonexus sp. R2A61]|uniref:hypothetical protein n=1 Tax=Azonexus sp. R2A61 TaxID=2744443 RepID=UPI001F3A7018|nr:hypothetical protein [Azonexus sp. R2A61]
MIAARPDKSTRELAISQAIRTITGLLKAVIYLLQHGVYVIGFRGWRNDAGVDRIVVQVAASPYLTTLFRDALWLRQHHDGVLTIHTWFVERWGVRIEWEDVCANTH